MKKKPAKTKRNKSRAKIVSKQKIKSKLRKSLPKKRVVKKQAKARRKVSRKQATKKFVMPSRWSSSTLGYMTSHCIKALHFYLLEEHYDKDLYQPGIAAHAILQEIGRRGLSDYQTIISVADEVVKTLTQKGRKFYNKPEPPMKLDHAAKGREIALQFVLFNPIPYPGTFEITYSIDANGNPCTMDEARLSAKMDCVYFTASDETVDVPGKIVVVRDYKSSWASGEKDLDTIQRHIQAVLAYKHHGKTATAVRVEVVNLRTGKISSQTINFDEDGIKKLEQWKHDALTLCDTAEKLLSAKKIEGIPGAGCLNCPFVMSCKWNKLATESKDDAIAYAATVARSSELKTRLLRRLDEYNGIKVETGIVGYKHTERSEIKTGAEKIILAKWYNMPIETVEVQHGNEVGLLNVLKPGVRSVMNFAKSKIPVLKERSEFLSSVIEKKGVAQFGVWPDKQVTLDQIFEGDNNGQS